MRVKEDFRSVGVLTSLWKHVVDLTSGAKVEVAVVVDGSCLVNGIPAGTPFSVAMDCIGAGIGAENALSNGDGAVGKEVGTSTALLSGSMLS